MQEETTEESYSEHRDTSREVGLSLVSNNFDNALDYAEIGLDAFVTNDILKEIPIVKTVVGVVKSGLKVKEIFFAKKILTFLKEFHSGKLPPNKVDEFREKFTADEKYREKVMEQVMIFNDTFLQVEKSKVFANLFAAHINDKYGWDDFINLSLCLEKMNMYAVGLLGEMANYEKPFQGAYHRDNYNVPLLTSSGIIEVWGTHLSITPFGIYMYYFGILGKIDGDIRKDNPTIFKEEQSQI